MDTALAQLHDRLSILEQENALLRSRLQSCEQTQAVPLLQAERKRSAELERQNTELQQTLDRLSESEHRYRTLFELSSEGIVRFGYKQPISVNLSVDEQLDLCYQSIYIAEGNKAFAQMYEYAKAEDIAGLTLSNFHDRNSQTTQTAMRAWIENRYTCRSLETEEFDRHGRKQYFLNSAISTIESDYVTSTWVSQVDITKLREIQEALLEAEQARVAELAKTNTVLKNSLDRLAANPDLNAFLGHVLLEIVQQFQIELGYLYLYDADSQTLPLHLYVAQGQVWSKHELEELVLLPFRQPSIDDLPIWETLLQTRQPFVITRENGAEYVFRGTYDWQVQHQEHQTGINLLLTLQDEPIGLLSLVSTRRSFSPEELELAQALAHQATLALHLTRLAEEAKQAVIAREQEKAAQERAVELAKANEALRRGVERLAEVGNIDALLDSFLLEAMTVTGASAGAVFDRVIGTEFQMRSLAQDGQLLNPADTEAFGNVLRAVSAYDRVGVFRQIIAAQVYCHEVDDYYASWFPEAAAFHRQQGNQVTWNFPFRVGGEVVGFLGLAFRERRLPNQVVSETVQALGHQVSLALETLRLAEEAKQAAIDREQEKAAQERAAELAKANESLRRSLRKLANEHNLDAYLEHILREALQMLDGTIAQIFLYDCATDTLTASVGVDQQGEFLPTPGLMSQLPIAQPFPANLTGIWQRLLNHRGAIQLDLDRDAADFWPGMIEWHRSRGNQAILCVPMLMGDVPLGLLGLDSTERIEFTVSELEFTQALVQQATLAIQLTRLAEEAKHAAILEERNRMASEIHDTLAQAFTGISIQLEVASPLVEQSPQAAQQILNHIRQLAENGLAEARRSVWALYPPAAEYADLAQLLYDSVEQMTRSTPIAVEVNVQGSSCPLPPFIGMNLLRIGQEALTNALKHAQAQTITIELVYESDRICLTIRDNGRGFTPPDTLDNLNGGFGLMGMYERCDRINAQLSLTSQLGQGTQILVEAPCS